MRRFMLLLAFAITACKSEGDRFADDYELAKTDPNLSGEDMCLAAEAAAAAYAKEHAQKEASRWRATASVACLRVRMGR